MKNFILLIALLLVFTGCEMLGGTDTPADSTQQTADQTTADNEAAEESEYDHIIVTENFRFTPSQITARAGQTLRILVNNQEGTHDLVIDGLNVATVLLAPGQSEVIELTIPEDAAGQTYEFHCSVGTHRQMGMVGTIIVSQ